jgi:hypothetical protein
VKTPAKEQLEILSEWLSRLGAVDQLLRKHVALRRRHEANAPGAHAHVEDKFSKLRV